MSEVDAIFNQIPVEESAPTERSEKKKAEPSDRILKGDTNSRIASFGDLVDDDDYGFDDKKGHENAKVEKDKAPVDNTPVDNTPAKKEEKKETVKPLKENEEVIEEKAPVEKVNPFQKHKVKVDGQEQEVELSELLSSYSSKQANARRFSDLDVEKKTFEKEKAQNVADIQNVQREVSELKGGFENILNEYSKNGYIYSNPATIVHQLLDKLGLNSNHFERAMFEYNLPEYARFFEMGEVEQDAYFAKKENEYLRGKDKTFSERTQSAQAENERQRKEFSIIKNAGLTVESYNELYGILEGLGDSDINAEKIVNFAKVKPIIDKANDIVKRTSRSGDSDLINKVSNLLMQFPNTTDEEIIEEIEGIKEEKRVMESLKDKEQFNTKVRPSKSSDDDDFDMEFFKSIRR